jgi:hypothetical protein
MVLMNGKDRKPAPRMRTGLIKRLIRNAISYFKAKLQGLEYIDSDYHAPMKTHRKRNQPRK